MLLGTADACRGSEVEMHVYAYTHATRCINCCYPLVEIIFDGGEVVCLYNPCCLSNGARKNLCQLAALKHIHSIRVQLACHDAIRRAHVHAMNV